VIGYQLSVTGYQLPVIGYRLPVISYRLSVNGYQLPGKSDLQTDESSLTTDNRQQTTNNDYFQLYSATDLGGLMLDGFGDGIWADAPDVSTKTILSTSFGILQATRSRISKTEYISCPSCGRTLFDLQITTQMIRSRTDHLKGLKIGIMGCIVNGPGEMADADYGYVGTGPGKITL
jgi:(E)-4-hydroxy-3-methylbut-2-enyl-diphosphate synthase